MSQANKAHPPFLDRTVVAMRAVRELKAGECINIGVGIPSLMINEIPPELNVVLHSEIGALNFKHVMTGEEADRCDYNYVLAGGQFTLPSAGMAFVDHGLAFIIVTGGRLDVSVMGAMQVSESGDLANWTSELDPKTGGIGGSFDLAIGARRVIVTMTHVTPMGEPKIVRKCSLPLTGKRCVKKIVTDAAVIDVRPEGLVLREVAPGWDPEQVQAITEPQLILAGEIKTIEL